MAYTFVGILVNFEGDQSRHELIRVAQILLPDASITLNTLIIKERGLCLLLGEGWCKVKVEAGFPRPYPLL